MNKEWSALQKDMVRKLRSEAEFRAGIAELLELRGRLAEEIVRLKQELPCDAGFRPDFFSEDYQRRMNAPIVTTGNELSGRHCRLFASSRH
ncbi:MAG: hypothetical protein HDR52_01740 [Treponema sp.]|nr:hypothetical protein [Treponema sp.]